MTDLEETRSAETIIPPAAPVSRMKFDGERGPLFKAMAEARKHFLPLSANATADVAMKNGGKYQFSYCPLDVMLEALAPGLQAAGIALMQPFDGDILYTIVACGDSSLTVETPLPTWSTPQELGSLLTYLRRYQVKGIFGVADSEDDDGNAASGNKVQVTRKEPTTSKPVALKMSEKMSSDLTAAAKANNLSRDEFGAMVFKHTGKKWGELEDTDGQKLLKVLGVVEVFGKDGAK